MSFLDKKFFRNTLWEAIVKKKTQRSHPEHEPDSLDDGDDGERVQSPNLPGQLNCQFIHTSECICRPQKFGVFDNG